MLKTVGRARLLKAFRSDSQTLSNDVSTPWQLVTNTSRAHFRATLVQAPLSGLGIALTHDTWDALLLKPQDASVRTAMLDVTETGDAS